MACGVRAGLHELIHLDQGLQFRVQGLKCRVQALNQNSRLRV